MDFNIKEKYDDEARDGFIEEEAFGAGEDNNPYDKQPSSFSRSRGGGG